MFTPITKSILEFSVNYVNVVFLPCFLNVWISGTSNMAFYKLEIRI